MMWRASAVVSVLLIAFLAAGASADLPLVDPLTPIHASVHINTSKVLRTFNPKRLGGTNIALWNQPDDFSDPQVHKWMTELNPGWIRLPGGSWGDIVYWNGNGVRDENGKVDPSRIGPDGYPAVDYSAFKPGFNCDPKTLHPDAGEWHGHQDVRVLHDFVKSIPGAEPLVIANAGTGRPIDAAEWVKWANKTNHYNVKYWEIGNELDGGWEAGHTLPFGKGTLTGEMYAERFHNFAVAMKAMDPTIKIGGATTGTDSKSFTRPMLEKSGADVDFVSIHTYASALTGNDKEQLDRIRSQVQKDVTQVREWIKKYQPDREKQIEVGYSEYNCNSDANATPCDMFSGIWLAVALREMALQGCDFAMQWDTFTHGRAAKNGHALIYGEGKPYFRKAQYYAMQLWNNYTGNELIESTQTGDESVIALASKTEDAVYLQLINTDRDHEAEVTLNLPDLHPTETPEIAFISSQEFFWNPISHQPEWSLGIAKKTASVLGESTITLRPWSISNLTISTKKLPGDSSAVDPRPILDARRDWARPELRLLVPTDVYVGDKVVGWLLASNNLTNSSLSPGFDYGESTITFSDDTRCDRKRVRTRYSAGRFIFQPTHEGALIVTAANPKLKTELTINVKPNIPKPIIFWDFDRTHVTDDKTFASDYKRVSDPSNRPNREVARIDFGTQGIAPTNKNQYLLKVPKFPSEKDLDRSNIRGACVDVQTSADFKCEDPDARIELIIQSPADRWMLIGSIPLKNHAKWQTHEVVTTNEKHFQAMPLAYNLLLVIRANKPLSGSIYLDRLGLMVR